MKNDGIVKCLGIREGIKYLGNKHTLALTTVLEGREGEFDDIAVAYDLTKSIKSIRVITFDDKGIFPNPSVTEKLTVNDKKKILDFVKTTGLENDVFNNIDYILSKQQ